MLGELAIFPYLILASGFVGTVLTTNPCANGCCNPCARCTSTPSQYQLVITGITNGSCTNCANYNKTYIVPQALGVDGTGCTYQIGITNTDCGTGISAYFVHVRALLNGANTRIRGLIEVDGPANVAFWQGDFGTDPIDCTSVSGYSPALANNFAAYCNSTAATCTITAL